MKDEKIKMTLKKMADSSSVANKRTYYDSDGVQTPDGKYVLTPIPQEDGSISYWLAEKGFTVAIYCFTVGHGGFSFAHQQKCMKQYIDMYKVRTS